MAYQIVNKNNRRVDGRIWKTKPKALSHVRGVVKNNSLKQRRMTGFVGLSVKKARVNERERMELKRAKNFIRD